MAVHRQSAAQRRAEGRHESTPRGLLTEERRSLQREHDDDGVLPPDDGAERRCLAEDRRGDHRPGQSPRAVRAEHALQTPRPQRHIQTGGVRGSVANPPTIFYCAPPTPVLCGGTGYCRIPWNSLLYIVW